MDIYKRERLILGKISFHHKTRVIFWRGQRVLRLLFRIAFHFNFCVAIDASHQERANPSRKSKV
jgi:hypothetical protein